MFTFLLCYKLKIFGLWHQNYDVSLRIIHLLWGLLVLLNEAPSRGNCVRGFVQEWSDFLWSLKVLEFLLWLLRLLDVVQTENKIPDWILLIQRVFGCFHWFLTCFDEMCKNWFKTKADCWPELKKIEIWTRNRRLHLESFCMKSNPDPELLHLKTVVKIRWKFDYNAEHGHHFQHLLRNVWLIG